MIQFYIDSDRQQMRRCLKNMACHGGSSWLIALHLPQNSMKSWTLAQPEEPLRNKVGYSAALGNYLSRIEWKPLLVSFSCTDTTNWLMVSDSFDTPPGKVLR